MKRGKFLTLEGGEGTGKSTQAARLVERLRGLGLEVVQTREPGGTPSAEALRELLVKGGADRWSPTAELLLMYAARADHLERVIRPALARGDWVVSDRFADSSRVYQGVAGGVDSALIEAIDQAVVGADQPDLTLILDVPVETGLARAKARGDDARFENKGLEYHRRLRAGFEEVAQRNPERCVFLRAADGAPPDAIADAIWHVVQTWIAETAAGAGAAND